MRNLAIMGIVALELMVVGCSSSSSTTTSSRAANGVWESALVGSDVGVGLSNFAIAFTVGSSGTLSVSYFSFLNTEPCFPLTGSSENGTFDVTSNTTTPSAKFTLNVQSGNSALVMTGTATGTTNSSGTVTWTSITGNWTLTGSGSCAGTGTFTMTQTSG